MEAKCYFCGADLEWGQTEMLADIDGNYENDGEAMAHKCRCPQCGRDYEIYDPMKDERESLYAEYWKNDDSTD